MTYPKRHGNYGAVAPFSPARPPAFSREGFIGKFRWALRANRHDREMQIIQENLEWFLAVLERHAHIAAIQALVEALNRANRENDTRGAARIASQLWQHANEVAAR